MAAIFVKAFGRFAIVVDGIEQRPPATHKAQALLAFLAMNPGVHHSREWLAELFWPDSQEDRSRARLSTAVWSIRKSFESIADRDHLATKKKSTIAWTGEAVVDARRFEKLAASGDPEDWRAALALYEGEFLEDDDSEWTRAERERLAAVYADVLAALLGVEPNTKNAAALLRRNPYHEGAHAFLIDDAVRNRRMPLARALYARAKRALERLGEEATLALERRYPILAAGDVATAHNLPAPLGATIGRDRELDRTLALLSAHRLVTIAGPGGIGKTRLAVEAARHCAEALAGGAWAIELASLSDAQGILAQVASALSVRASSDGRTFDAVVEQHRSSALLLLFDNCERLVSECAEVVAALLAAIPGLAVIVTSREPLGLDGEEVFRLEPLAEPDAVALFNDRARSTTRRWPAAEFARTIASIVGHLDGLPLAIELVAALTDALSPAQVLEALESHAEILRVPHARVTKRHQTLRALFDWSYELLSDQERRFFRALGAFVGPFGAEAAASVCGDGDAAAMLASLARKSLVRGIGEDRANYSMLEPVRDFAVDRATEDGETREFQSAHARYYSSLVERLDAELGSERRETAVAELSAEWTNVRIALARSFEDLDPQRGRRLAAILGRFWWESGRWAEGRLWLERALALDHPMEERERAALLEAATFNVAFAGDYPALRALAVELVELWERAGDVAQTVRARHVLAVAEYYLGNSDAARRLWESALQNFESIGDRDSIAVTLNNLGSLALDAAGDCTRARAYLESSLALHREFGNSVNLAAVLSNLSRVAFYEGRFDDAYELARESGAVFERLGNEAGGAAAQVNVALAHFGLKRLAQAAECLAAAYVHLARTRVPSTLDRYFEAWIAIAHELEAVDAAATLAGFANKRRADAHLGTPYVLSWARARGQRPASELSTQRRAELEMAGAHLTLDDAERIVEDLASRCRDLLDARADGGEVEAGASGGQAHE